MLNVQYVYDEAIVSGAEEGWNEYALALGYYYCLALIPPSAQISRSDGFHASEYFKLWVSFAVCKC
ncbi:hypothetical protein TorRG33x02_106970 [Trema orientale]|uniref:Uncharacterized protein n=1 Tax=Trema orientale TaxID=63057 RepID=A0A2P5F6M3_TREOI|nr:hypothetical protein TorRG33x02_106970 [Trema orientale]